MLEYRLGAVSYKYHRGIYRFMTIQPYNDPVTKYETSTMAKKQVNILLNIDTSHVCYTSFINGFCKAKVYSMIDLKSNIMKVL